MLSSLASDFLTILAILILIGIAIIRCIIKYAAKEFAKEFAQAFHYEEMAKRNGVEIRNGINYDYLARKISEEMRKL